MPKKPRAKAQNKSEFVRSMPSGLSAAEIVAKAKAAGMQLTPGHVYTIRAAAKRKRGEPPGKPGRKGLASRTARPSSSTEQQFVALALELGLGRAQALLSLVRTHAAALS